MAKKKQKKKEAKGAKDDRSGMAIPAGLLIGIGIGLLIGQVAAFTMIGLGVGFLIGYMWGK
ncbi:hypothetical protein GOV13_01310 [Candidatus Pacearchaeota archaeon]|nr:hypothetical protein [Candidatus Pacearchaeota archaeon]